jgi:mercuric ion binding protein
MKTVNYGGRCFWIFALALCFAAPAFAEQKTVVLQVDNMPCASCPIMVKTALSKVKGVTSAEVSLKSHSATVRYDDAVTNIETLMKATANAGFPSRLAVEKGKK